MSEATDKRQGYLMIGIGLLIIGPIMVFSAIGFVALESQPNYPMFWLVASLGTVVFVIGTAIYRKGLRIESATEQSSGEAGSEEEIKLTEVEIKKRKRRAYIIGFVFLSLGLVVSFFETDLDIVLFIVGGSILILTWFRRG